MGRGGRGSPPRNSPERETAGEFRASGGASVEDVPPPGGNPSRARRRQGSAYSVECFGLFGLRLSLPRRREIKKLPERPRRPSLAVAFARSIEPVRAMASECRNRREEPGPPGASASQDGGSNPAVVLASRSGVLELRPSATEA